MESFRWRPPEAVRGGKSLLSQRAQRVPRPQFQRRRALAGRDRPRGHGRVARRRRGDGRRPARGRGPRRRPGRALQAGVGELGGPVVVAGGDLFKTNRLSGHRNWL